MSTEFCKVLRNRCKGTYDDGDLQAYFQFVDAIIKPVYYNRYGSFTPQLRGAVELVFFTNACWEKMEGSEATGRTIFQKICGKNFADDRELKNYIWRAFDNLLTDLIYERTPNLKTRVHQINRLLRTFCDVRTKHCRCPENEAGHPESGEKKRAKPDKTVYWQLKSLKTPPSIFLGPMEEQEALRDCLSIHPPPAAEKFPKKDGTFGMRIPDQQMETFLRCILKEIGGVISKNGLIAFISEIYNLVPLVVAPYPIPGDEMESEGEIQGGDEIFSDLSLSVEYYLMAVDMIKPCDDMAKAVYTHYYCEELKQTAIARILNVANSTVSNKIRDIELCFRNFVVNHPMSEDEWLAFADLICRILISNKEVRQ